VLALAENSIQLVPDGTLLLHILVIVGMIAILNVTLFKPINRILEQRDIESRGGLSEARRTLAKVDQKLALYERSLREARAQSYSLLERGRAKALGERGAEMETLREELNEWSTREKGELSRQAIEVRKTLADEAVRVGAEIGSHILGRRVG
jgi:F0F1-type ATP synthase membrane subunit b/b'